jgi:hypothetical protein
LLDRVLVNVAGEIVEITWGDRDALVVALNDVYGCEAIVEKFWHAGPSLPVELDQEQQLLVRLKLERWGVSVLPDGLARLLITLVRHDPGGGVGARRPKLPRSRESPHG